LADAILTLPKWFEPISKLNPTLHEHQTRTFGQRKRKENKNKKFTYEAMAIFVNP
jgi:hypothetical protein